MHINLPEFELSYIVPLKSGNRVIYSTLIELFKANKINFELSNVVNKNCFLFVRNPIDRFFSSHNWFFKIKNSLYEEKNNFTQQEKKLFDSIEKLFNEYELNSLSGYINNYKKFINVCDDFHYLPQTSFFITKSIDLGIRANLNFNFRKEYERLFKGVLNFYRIEEIDDLIEINRNHLLSVKFNREYSIENTLENQKIKEFEFLSPLPKNLNHQFMIFYTYFKNYFDKGHHEHKVPKIVETITKEEYLMTLDMFRKEMLFFGYDDEINLKKINFKKNMV